ncbi:MAG TPA: cytochrome P450 [Vicinamibacterales bacterium]|jgi:cytochrome P450|nr:cytochrome P450 [Vicinamibacterales bacterium]
MNALPPGPKPSLFSGLVYRPGRNPLEFFTNIARTYGDLAHVRLGREHLFIVSDPHLIKEVLVTHNRNFTKSRGLERTKRLLGEGLLTSEGAVHLRQRRLMQPAFHRERITNYAATMIAYAERLRDSWTDGATVDVAREMSRLTLSVVGKTLFDTDVQSQAREVGDALTGVMESFWTLMLPFSKAIERLPLPHLRRSRQARARLDAIIYGLIRERRASGADRGDLLSMLLLAQDEEDEGRRMTDVQVRDEAMTIFLAGHETTANALMWTWYLLSQAPTAERALHAEIDRVLHGRRPTMADMPALPYVERVVTESMRLYPPAWIIGRRAIEPHPLNGYMAPARSIIIMSPWIVHRDARYYAQPERFDPDRWTPELKASIPPFAYFPFGAGPRRCIGESFAWMELMLTVATLAQRWRFELVSNHPVVPQPLVTLRAKYGMKMIAHRRPESTRTSTTAA